MKPDESPPAIPTRENRRCARIPLRIVPSLGPMSNPLFSRISNSDNPMPRIVSMAEAIRGSFGPRLVCNIKLAPPLKRSTEDCITCSTSERLVRWSISRDAFTARVSKPFCSAQQICLSFTGEQLPVITMSCSTAPNVGAGDLTSSQYSVRAYSIPDEPTTKHGPDSVAIFSRMYPILDRCSGNIKSNRSPSHPLPTLAYPEGFWNCKMSNRPICKFVC